MFFRLLNRNTTAVQQVDPAEPDPHALYTPVIADLQAALDKARNENKRLNEVRQSTFSDFLAVSSDLERTQLHLKEAYEHIECLRHHLALLREQLQAITGAVQHA